MRRTLTQVIGAIAVEDRDGVAVGDANDAAFRADLYSYLVRFAGGRVWTTVRRKTA